jgi:N-acetylmuramoyl-L-alanine amidase
MFTLLIELMEDVAQTKVRLIREAVEENLPRGPHSKVRIARPPGVRRVWLYFAAAALVVAFVVAATIMNNTVPQPSAAAALPVTAPAPEPVVTSEPIPPPDVTPTPLNRGIVPLAVRKIVIDAGHGGVQTGAIAQSGVREKEITLQIALRLQQLLQEHEFEVIMTRAADKTLDLDERAALANTGQGDLFMSIHVNSVPGQNVHPLETYYLGSTDDPHAISLAAIENRESGYSLSEYRQLVEKIYLDARRDESRRFARAVHNRLYQMVRQLNPETQDRGVKTAPFVVLIRTEMPAILVEVSSLSNEDDVKLLAEPDYQQNIAEALLQGIRSYANDLNRAEEKIAKHGTIN